MNKLIKKYWDKNWFNLNETYKVVHKSHNLYQVQGSAYLLLNPATKTITVTEAAAIIIIRLQQIHEHIS
jgi:virulence-associated protein VapD